MRFPRSSSFLLCLLTTFAAVESSALADPSKKSAKVAEPELPPLEGARLWLIAPSPNEPWTLRIDNEGETALRIPADARLLRVTIEQPEGPVEATKKPKVKAKAKIKPVRCEAPVGLRPESYPETRALILPPKTSYVERFDPHLLCFGKAAEALAGSNIVRARFGWDDAPKRGKKTQPVAPFAVEGTVFPLTHAPLRGIEAPTLVLPYASSAETRPEGADQPTEAPAASNDAKPASENVPAKHEEKPAEAATKASVDKPAEDAPPANNAESPSEPAPTGEAGAPVVDELRPRIEVTSEPFADASSPHTVQIAVTVKNVGHRTTLIAAQTRNFAFQVKGPTGTSSCDAFPATHAAPREAFQSLASGATKTFNILIDELCPRLDFSRPGLYRVTPVLHAVESGSRAGVDAWTGTVAATTPTLVRVATATSPYYATPPVAIPTPK